jgi:hypothetical protein
MNPGLVAHTVKLILGIYTATKSVFAGSPKKFFFFFLQTVHLILALLPFKCL